LAWIPLGNIGGNDKTEYTIPQILQFLIITLTKRKTVFGPRGNDDLLTILCLFLPDLRAIYIGFMTTRLRKQVEIFNTALPAIPF
jgi:hypothetical protein